MSKKLRYTIIGICVATFLGLAPLLVFFVRGISYNTEESELHATGILAIKTEPADVAIKLNGIARGSTPASIRFLQSNDYDVELYKDGYFTWSKRLSVTNGKVTWANDNIDHITLLKKDQSPDSITIGADTYIIIAENKLAYTAGKALIILSGKNLEETHSISLPGRALSLHSSPSGSNILVMGGKFTIVVNTKTYTASKNSNIPADATPLFISDTEILSLSHEVLERINIESNENKKIFSGVQAVTLAGNQLYILQQSGDGSKIITTNLDYTGATQTVVSNAKTFKKSKIFITLQRQALVLGDGVLYRVGNTLEELIGNVQDITFDQKNANLIFTLPGELHYYNFDENKVVLITRSNDSFSNLVIRRDLNYAFYFHKGALSALELDSRDRQNSYVLTAVSDPKKFTFTEDDTIILQDGNNISALHIK